MTENPHVPFHLPLEALEEGLEHIRSSPRGEGVIKLIVRRPEKGAREILRQAQLDLVEGLVGDNWRTRGSSRTEDGTAHPEMQVTLTNARAMALIANEPSREPLAGDQFFVDLDLSVAHLPTGTRLGIGEVVLEVTATPHNGCKKFAERFGKDAVRFVNGEEGKALRLRGVNARVITPGEVSVGDAISVL